MINTLIQKSNISTEFESLAISQILFRLELINYERGQLVKIMQIDIQ